MSSASSSWTAANGGYYSGGEKQGGGGGGSDAAAAVAVPAPRFPSSKLKLDELFLHWLSMPESQKLVLGLLEDARAGKPLSGPPSGWLSGNSSPLSPSSAQALLAIAIPPLSPAKSSPPRSPLSPKKGFRGMPSPTASPTTGTGVAGLPGGGGGAGRGGGGAGSGGANTQSKKSSDGRGIESAGARKDVVPRFYFPRGGRPVSKEETDAARAKIAALFSSATNNAAPGVAANAFAIQNQTTGPRAGAGSMALGLPEHAFARIVRDLCGLPTFFGALLFRECGGVDGRGEVSAEQVRIYWESTLAVSSLLDDAYASLLGVRRNSSPNKISTQFSQTSSLATLAWNSSLRRQSSKNGMQRRLYTEYSTT